MPFVGDFKGRLRTALQFTDPAKRLDGLSELAQCQLSYLETIQLDRALGQLKLDSIPGYSRVRLAILASSTVDHLASGIRVAGLRRRLLIDIYCGAYGQYRHELLDSTSQLYEFGPEVILFSLTARELTGSVPITATPTQADERLTAYVDELRQLWQRARDAFNATVIQQTFLDTSESLFGSLDRQIPASPARLVAQLNSQLSDTGAAAGILLLDVAQACNRDGRDNWFDSARWFQAKQEIAPQAAPIYGELLARILAALRGLSKKCLVLDLDNTLWHGVVGDDGNRIAIGEGSAVGEAHLSLQRYAKQLRDRGIILAVCSKNDSSIVEEVFRTHPEMHLRRSDFGAFVVNWRDKAENLMAIATQLNIGVDSLVFLDDNPAERARIRQALPMVGVPELPEDAAGYVRCLAEAGYFESVGFTSDDQNRSTQYAANEERERLEKSTQSIDEFLQSLEMSVEFAPFAPVDLLRVAQLINKTNQFNPTTRRYTVDQVNRFAATPECLTLQFRLMDRFGDNGLVSAMILVPDETCKELLVMDTWVMSCRVFGRQLELEAMNIAAEAALLKGIRRIRADYFPTAKNGVIRELFPNLGFAAASSETSDGSRWFLDLSAYVPKKTHIRRIH